MGFIDGEGLFLIIIRTTVVEGEFIPSKWQTPEDRSGRPGNSDGCFNDRMGGIMSGSVQRRQMVKAGTEKAYKCVRTFSSKVSPFNLLEGSDKKDHSLTDRQYDSSKLPG